MNDKVYANYLMHGRTKGSRNGISTTKGYTAVGQKAKGHLVNGKYVYDAGVNLPTNYNGLDNYMKVSNSNKTQPYLHSLYPKGYANASDAMKNDPRYSSDSVYVVKYKGSDLNPKPVTKNDPDAKALRDYIGRLYVTNKQSVATNVAKAGKDKIALNKYDDKPQYLGHKELSDINNNLMLKKIKDEVASKLKAEKEEAVKAKTVVGSKNDWQQQAALEQWKQQNRNNIAASKKKKAEAFDKASDAYRLGLSYPVDQMANRTRTVNEHYNKNWKNNTTINYDSPGSGAYLDAKKAKDAAYLRGKNAVNKAAMNGTNTNASQQAELERWKKQNQNAIAASKKASLKEELRRNAALNKYTTKDWQNKANIARANTEVRNKVVSGESNKGYTPYAEPGRVSNGIADEKTRNIIRLENLRNRVYAEQNKKAKDAEKRSKNAMQNDPRYSTGLREIKDKNGKVVATYSHSPLVSTPNGRTKYDYSGKNDDRAPTFKALGKKPEKMDRDPYFNEWANASNKQEEAKAIAGNKAFMNSFRESKIRNSRSDLGNAIADAKEDAKNAFKSLKNKFKKKKKK